MKKYAIGMMSGTSLDGIDVTLLEISGSGLNTQVNEVYSKTYTYPEKILNRIKMAMSQETSDSELICSLNVELSEVYSTCVFRMLKESSYSIEEVDYIASHGQTIYHNTKEGDNTPSSLQLGDGSILANLTNTTVVSNFRQADIAAGGEGAPLVPYADYVLFSNTKKTRCLQNIGGISNVTVLPRGCTLDDVYAFDNGPGNMMIDYAMSKLFKKPYDQDGKVASEGDLILDMFEEIISLEYFKLEPPKSTGRELFGDAFTDKLLCKYSAYAPKDIITTLTHVTAYTIAESYKMFIQSNCRIDEVIISGGGAHNKTLIKLIEEYMQFDKVFTTNNYGVSSDYKEAISFAILANETLQMKPSNCKNATGATKDVILGQISYVLK